MYEYITSRNMNNELDRVHLSHTATCDVRRTGDAHSVHHLTSVAVTSHQPVMTHGVHSVTSATLTSVGSRQLTSAATTSNNLLETAKVYKGLKTHSFVFSAHS